MLQEQGTLHLGPKVADIFLKDVYLHFGYIVDMIQLIHNKTHSSCSFMYKLHFSGDFMSNHLPALGFEPLAFHLSEIFLTLLLSVASAVGEEVS